MGRFTNKSRTATVRGRIESAPTRSRLGLDHRFPRLDLITPERVKYWAWAWARLREAAGSRPESGEEEELLPG
jgi:hypothetical protein